MFKTSFHISSNSLSSIMRCYIVKSSLHKPHMITTQNCALLGYYAASIDNNVTTQKSAVLSFFAAEAWYHTWPRLIAPCTPFPIICRLPVRAQISLFPAASRQALECTLSDAKGRIVESVWRLAMGWTVRGSNPARSEIFPIRPHRHWRPTSRVPNR